MDLGGVAGWSALVAAVATVVGAVFLGLFFSRGQPWGTLNDLASIVMMLATIPVALFLADAQADEGASVAAAIGVVGMLGASLFQGLLVARIRTYEALLPYTLAAGVVVGAWYILVGGFGLAWGWGMPTLLSILAIAAGLGYVAVGFGFWRGGERNRVAIIGGVVLLVASTAFLAWVGIAAIAAGALTA